MSDENIIDRLLESFDICRSFFDATLESLRPIFGGPMSKFEPTAVHKYEKAEQLLASAHPGVDDHRRFLEEEIAKHLDGFTGHLGEIIKHATAIRDLNSRLNAILPISKLPPEVLREIFFQYKALRISSAQDATAWQSVAHICRHWRTIAIQCPLLWTSISFAAKDDCIAEFLARSQQSPLSVQQAVFPLKSVEVGRVLAEEMPRIEKLGLTIYRAYGPPPNPLITDSTPFLRSLILNGGRESRMMLGPVGSDVPFWSKILYGEAAPQLQQLRMSGIGFQWHHGFRHPNMRDLRILSTRYTSSDPGVESITAALAAMPLLEVLVLHRCLPSTIQPSEHGDQLVTLPHLRSIAITGSSSTCAGFLSYLDFPSDSSIRLGVPGSSTDLSHAEPLQTCLARFVEAYPLQHLKVSDGMTIFRFAPAGEIPQSIDTDFGDLEVVRALPEFIVVFACNALSSVCEHFALCGVIELTIRQRYQNVFESGGNELLTNTFRKMPNIRTLHVQDLRNRRKFLNRHRATVDNSIPTVHPDSNVMPQLRELTLHHDELLAGDQELILAYLERRQESGLELEQITLLSPLPEKRQHIIISRLENVVRKVIWDLPLPDGPTGYVRCAPRMPKAKRCAYSSERFLPDMIPLSELDYLHMIDTDTSIWGGLFIG